jgi:hypothetical protein
MDMLDLNARIFTHGDLVRVSRQSSGTIQNWQNRDRKMTELLKSLGRVRGGRMTYNVLDLVAYRVIGAVVDNCEMQPSVAWALAGDEGRHPVMTRHPVMSLEDKGPQKPGPFEEQEFLLAYSKPKSEQFSALVYLGKDLPAVFAKIGHPVVIVPLSQIWFEVCTECVKILKEEESSR